MTAPTPIVASLSARYGLDPSKLHGTGPEGRVTVGDVRAAAARQQQERRAAASTIPTAAGRPAVHRRPEPIGSITASGSAPVEPWLLAENDAADAAPDVRDLANRRGVRLSAVTGTGRDGAVRAADVTAAADQQDRRWARASQIAHPEPAAPVEPRVTFTASGLPVSVLAEVPAPVRRALAAASTHAEAFALVERYPRNLSDDEAAERLASDRSVSVRYGGAAPVAWTS